MGLSYYNKDGAPSEEHLKCCHMNILSILDVENAVNISG